MLQRDDRLGTGPWLLWEHYWATQLVPVVMASGDMVLPRLRGPRGQCSAKHTAFHKHCSLSYIFSLPISQSLSLFLLSPFPFFSPSPSLFPFFSLSLSHSSFYPSSFLSLFSFLCLFFLLCLPSSLSFPISLPFFLSPSLCLPRSFPLSPLL